MYLPLDLLNNYTEKGDISWQELDLVRTIYRRQNKLPDEVYITRKEVFEAIVYKEKITLEEKDKDLVSQALFMATVLSVLASWRISKQVYHFEEEMEKLLYSQAEDEMLLPVEVLKNMPYPCAYFEAPNLLGDRFHGFFVCFDIDRDMELLKFLPLHSGGESVEIRSIELKAGYTLKECAAAPLKVQYNKQNVDAELDEYIGLIEKMLQLVLYVCAANADIQKADPGRKIVKPRSIADIKDKYREISRWDVGNNIVKKIRNRKKTHTVASSSETDEKEYNNQTAHQSGQHHVTPHVRKGHWQSYWTGKKDGSEERKLVLRWKHFIYVNASKPDELPVTINCIKDDIEETM